MLTFKHYLIFDNKHAVALNVKFIDVLHVINKHDILERFYVFKDANVENQMNDRNSVTSNTLSDGIIQNDVSL
jgi:hypothetical protein